MEEGGLGRFVVLNGDIVLDGQLDGPLVGDGGRPGNALNKGQGPVIAVVGEAQKDLLRRDLRHRVVQHGPHIWQGGHRHGRTRGVAPLIGHQEHAVYSGTHGGVVVALVQEPCLSGGGLGRQGGPEEESLRVEKPPQPGQEGGIGRRQLAGEELEVHVQAGVAPAAERLLDLSDQAVLHGGIRQHQSGPLGVELTGLCQGGKVHHRPDAPLPRGGEQCIILQLEQVAFGGDAVGEGRQVGEIGELRIQQGLVDVGIGVTVEGGGGRGGAEIGDHQDLSGPKRSLAAEGPVVLPETADRGAVGFRDGGQGLSGPDGVDLAGKADHKGLPHRQGTAGGHGVVRGQAGGVDAVGCCDGADGLAGLDHMDRHAGHHLRKSLFGKVHEYTIRPAVKPDIT